MVKKGWNEEYRQLMTLFQPIIIMGIQCKPISNYCDIIGFVSFIYSFYFWRDFFGTLSPYADLLDVLKNPPKLYKLSDGNVCVRKKQPPIRHPLALTLHEIFFGGVKKMKIHRLVFIDTEQTRTEVKEKILTIPIKPGIMPNTEIILPEEGDQNPTQIPGKCFFCGDLTRLIYHIICSGRYFYYRRQTSRNIYQGRW